MEINGLPLHPLVVHAAVIFGPLAALAALAYLVPRWRDVMRWPMVIMAVVGVGAIVAAYFTGNDFLDNRPELGQLPQVQKHEDLGEHDVVRRARVRRGGPGRRLVRTAAPARSGSCSTCCWRSRRWPCW